MAIKKTITDMFEPFCGVKEYDGIVRKMIEWYYGSFKKVAWCAISMSYMANQLGVLDQFGGKEQNCYRMLKNIEKTVKKTGKGTLKYAKELKKDETIKRGSVIFMLMSEPPMTEGSKKHVTTAHKDFKYKGTGYFESLGGNQSDYIKVKEYTQKTIYAVFFPDYEDEKPLPDHPTLRKGDKGTAVKEMQNDLRKLGFANISGQEMVADGSFGKITQSTVIAFQVLTALKADGICGPVTWKKIDELLLLPKCQTTALTDVNVRIGPGTGYKKIGMVEEGDKVTYTTFVDGWLYLPAQKGWSRSKWYNLT